MFTGAAFFSTLVGQPARLAALNDAALLAEWKLSYKGGIRMNGSLAILSGILGVSAYVSTRSPTPQPLWLCGAGAILVNWPFTLIVLMPTINTLLQTSVESAGEDTRQA
jgi:hypothetical protein